MTKKLKTLAQISALSLLLGTGTGALPFSVSNYQIVHADDKSDEDDWEDDFYFLDFRQEYSIKTAHKEYGKNSGIYYTKNAKLSEEELTFYADTLKHLDKFWGGKKVLGDDYEYPHMILYRDSITIDFDDEDDSFDYEGTFYLGGIFFVDVAQMEDIAPKEAQKVLVLAHEMGHHIQNNLGFLADVMILEDLLYEEGKTLEANEWSIRLELQADYFAGVFSNYLEIKKLYTLDNLLNALETAKNTGDDVIMGDDYDERHSDHGTAKQRMNWFLKGNIDGEKNKWLDNFHEIFELDFDVL